MYKLVETKEEREVFNRIFKGGFEEKNYVTTDEYQGEDRQSYLVENVDGEYGATFEMVPYQPHTKNTLLEFPEKFLEYDYILESLGSVMEMDKLTVNLSDRKRNTLDNVLESIYLVTKQQNIKYLIAEFNPVFFRALKISFGLKLMKAGKMREGGDGHKYKLQPAIVSMEEIWKEYEMKHKSGVGV